VLLLVQLLLGQQTVLPGQDLLPELLLLVVCADLNKQAC
jgi:hypothetical protein